MINKKKRNNTNPRRRWMDVNPFLFNGMQLVRSVVGKCQTHRCQIITTTRWVSCIFSWLNPELEYMDSISGAHKTWPFSGQQQYSRKWKRNPPLLYYSVIIIGVRAQKTLTTERLLVTSSQSFNQLWAADNKGIPGGSLSALLSHPPKIVFWS